MKWALSIAPIWKIPSFLCIWTNQNMLQMSCKPFSFWWISSRFFLNFCKVIAKTHSILRFEVLNSSAAFISTPAFLHENKHKPTHPLLQKQRYRPVKLKVGQKWKTSRLGRDKYWYCMAPILDFYEAKATRNMKP